MCRWWLDYLVKNLIMIHIGLIGYNEGNGHPYSFSAIINGYDQEEMSRCPYSVIYNYLQARPLNEIGLEGMSVTHVWCPDKNIAESIAKCSHIPYVVDYYEEMLNSIDAIIIARDDVESHFPIAKFFLDNGKYVLVDKPLTVDAEQLNYYKPFLEYGKLLSCSGLRYKSEMRTSFYGKLKKENVLFVNAFSVLDWKKYAIHVLEAVTPIMGTDIQRVVPMHSNDNLCAKIEYSDDKYLMIQMNKKVSFGINATFYTKDGGNYHVDFDDNFGCFRYMLLEFRRMIMTGKAVIPPIETIRILKAIINGNENA